MIVIGLVGGIGSGKSVIGDAFENLYSAKIIRADELGHQAMLPSGPGYQPIIDLFGQEILDDEGFIDRSIISQIVFKDSLKLELLNHIIHRIVFDQLKEMINSLREMAIYDFVLIEAALLIVDEFLPLIDQLWYVKSNKELRIQRLKKSRHMSKEQILSIMEAQPDDLFYEQYANYIINNNHTIEACMEQIYSVIKNLSN